MIIKKLSVFLILMLTISICAPSPALMSGESSKNKKYFIEKGKRKKRPQRGHRGPPGIAGLPGSAGLAGEKGACGEKGSWGEKGEKGDAFCYPTIDGTLTVTYSTNTSPEDSHLGTWQIVVIAPDLSETRGEEISFQEPPGIQKSLTVQHVMKGTYIIMVYIKSRDNSLSFTGSLVQSLKVAHSSGTNFVTLVHSGDQQFVSNRTSGESVSYFYPLVIP